MDLDALKNSIETKVYKIPAKATVPLHKHTNKDEVFYCIRGSGFGVLQDEEVPLTSGIPFVVRAGTMHSLRTDSELIVTSFLIPVTADQS